MKEFSGSIASEWSVHPGPGDRWGACLADELPGRGTKSITILARAGATLSST